ncbi:MAG: helix-turn-helix domain-containing protein [Pseudomonadota bacterium]|jgi:transcriptional regulator with XRE-family HTH domain
MATAPRNALQKQIGAQLRAVRERRGFTMRHVAGLLGVADSTVQRWELGLAELGVATAIGLAKLYETTLPELIGEAALALGAATHAIAHEDVVELLQLAAAQAQQIDRLRRRGSAALLRAVEQHQGGGAVERVRRRPSAL